jgi:hypothetical protein
MDLHRSHQLPAMITPGFRPVKTPFTIAIMRGQISPYPKWELNISALSNFGLLHPGIEAYLIHAVLCTGVYISFQP